MSEISRRVLLQAGVIGALPGVSEAHPARRAPSASSTQTAATSVRERLLMDFDWRFQLGHACDPAKDFGYGKDQSTYAKSGFGVADAAEIDFDDNAWHAINLPHDWAVELAPVPTIDPPKDDPRAMHGFRPLGRQYPENSIGWYRRSFTLPTSDSGRRLALEFDGVFRDCIVMLNGFVIGSNESGYAPFRIDITDYANCGGKNVLVIRVDATLGEGWFYEGAGIYRHVWLTKSDSLHIPQWGVSVHSAVLRGTAALSIATEIANDGDAARTFRVVWTVLDSQSQQVARSASASVTLPARTSQTIAHNTSLAHPSLWSVETPNLYRLLTQIVEDDRVVDDSVAPFGIRTIHFDAEKGFFLNGELLKLKGTCNHQDFAGIGSALPDRIHDFRVETLKAMGANAYRCAHNPPAPELLDACDRLGMLVIDETRRMASDEEGLSELTRMIRRDRNHPCVILWSIGNEEHAEQGTDTGARVAGAMRRRIHELDSTRPITAAMDEPKAWGLGITPTLDVMGANYRTDQLIAFHVAHPTTPLVCTEISSSLDTRGIYVRNPQSGYEAAYDTEFPWWGSTQEAAWSIVASHTFLSGGFVWAGFDYRGEPTPQTLYPNNSSQCGLMDTCGFPKDNYFYYRAWWRNEPSLHLFPHWNWATGQTINVWSHSNLERVELFLNGVSQGVRTVVPYKHVEWDVPYAAGVLEARGYRGGQVVLAAKRETTGAPACINLIPNRASMSADGEDVVIVRAEILDPQGRIVPTASNRVAFEISGPGAIIGVGNGDPRCVEPDKASARSAFNGLCLAVLQAAKSPGTIELHATSPGLEVASVTIVVQPARLRPAVA